MCRFQANQLGRSGEGIRDGAFEPDQFKSVWNLVIHSNELECFPSHAN